MKNIKHIGPNDKVRKPKPPTEEEIGLKHQMSQFYSLKATIEELFGNPMYMDLKETTDLEVWRKTMKSFWTPWASRSPTQIEYKKKC